MQEGRLQGARRACSACLKGLVLDRVKAPVDRTAKHSLHDREGGQGKRRQSNMRTKGSNRGIRDRVTKEQRGVTEGEGDWSV